MNFTDEVSQSGMLYAPRVRELAREAGFSEAGVVALPHTHETRDA
jgi:cell division GTPase FtsZ